MNNKIDKIYDVENAELKIVVPVNKKTWKEEQEKAFNKIAKKIKIPGYRPGKVPLEIAKKNISEAQIWEEALSKILNIVINDAAKEIDEKNDIVLDSPTYSIEKDKISKDNLEITFIYPIFPKVEIKKFNDYKIKFALPTNKDIEDSVKKQIDDLLSRGTLLLPKENDDAKVENGDTIIFDFKGYIDDVAFEGGEAEKYELKIGSSTFIPGFEEQLIGKKKGWEGSINVKFPKDYYKEEYRQKEARFDIKIHEIKYNDKQELNEEFIKSLNIKGVETEKQLNEYLKNLTKRELIEKNRITFMNEFVTKIIEDNNIPTPRAIVFRELSALMKKFEENLKKQGFSKKDYYEITGYTDDKVKEELKEEANRSVKKSMIYSLLSKDLKIKPTDEDFNRQYEKIGKLYNIDPQIAYNMIKKEQIEAPLINELLIDKLIVMLNPDVVLEKEQITFVPKKTEIKEKKDDNKEENKSK